MLFVLAGVHLGMWIYSVSLFGNDEMRLCHPRDRFFLKCYLFGYGAMIIGGVVVFVVLLLSAVGVTVSTLRRNKKEGEEEIEI